jgi:catechol 2,3-dioxygenase-like lactoylglutathione lyase family enzyme
VKPNSISGITCYVKELGRTRKFYETLGFRPGKGESDRATFYVNWFFVTFIAQDKVDDALRKEAEVSNKGGGLYLYIKVDDVDAFHKAARAKRLKPQSEPRDQPMGNREFVLRDPDGYKLVFFQKK